VRTEAAIFVIQQQIKITGVDILRVRRKPPAPVNHGERAQQLAVAVKDGGGDFLCVSKWERRK
jgi:hypothetical protein